MIHLCSLKVEQVVITKITKMKLLEPMLTSMRLQVNTLLRLKMCFSNNKHMMFYRYPIKLSEATRCLQQLSSVSLSRSPQGRLLL